MVPDVVSLISFPLFSIRGLLIDVDVIKRGWKLAPRSSFHFRSLSRRPRTLCDESLIMPRLAFVPIPEGCGGKRSHLGPLPRLGLS